MSSFGEIVMEYVCPALGTVMATLMFFAPYQDLREAVRRGSLGILNPTPWAFMLGNCFGWVVYSILIQNLWVFFANAPGLLLSVWLNLGACKLLYQGHYSKEMRQAFAAYLEGQQQQQQQEQQKQQQQEQLHPLAPSHPRLNDVDNATTPGQQLTKQLSSQRLLAAVALPDPEPPSPSHQRSPSALVMDVVTELFTGPVMGPGHKRTLSQSVAEEFHLHPLLAAAVPPPPASTDGTADEENGIIDADDVEHANTNNDNDNKPSDDSSDPITNDKGNVDTMAVDNNDGNDENEQDDKAKPKHRRAPSATEALTQTVGEALSQAATAVTDFTKVVWDVTAQTTPAPAPHENMVLGIVVVWTAVVSALAFAEAINGTAKELVVGIVTNCFLVFFYGAPLSTIVTVLKDGNSDSIHVPTMITNTMSSVFWAVYGLALGDWFIAAPNCVGSFLGAAQIVLSVLYPRTTATLAPSKPKRRVKSATTGSTQAASHWWHRTGTTTNNNDDAGIKKDNVVTFAMDQPKNTGRGSNHTDDSAHHGAHPLSGGGDGMSSTDNPKDRDVEAVSINP